VTIGGESARQSKNERREAAREKARQLREEQKRRERRNRALLFSGIGIAAVAIIAVVAFIIFTSIRPAGPGPANMASDGVKIGQNLEAVTTAALPAGSDPVPSEANPAGIADIRIWVDYLCPFCGQFEATNSEQIQSWVTEGSATIEIHPISILNSQSQGTRYSTRSANAAACVANYSPNSFYAYNSILFENQPEEGTAGLDNETLVSLAGEAGVESAGRIEECITEGDFTNWVTDATTRALTGPLPDTDVAKVTGTPTVIVNGAQYRGSLTDPTEFAAFVLEQTAEAAATPTPSPTPTATPAG
jgi:protein-disulfide isomerase